MNRERFELALARLKPSQWELFEQLASTFLAAEFPGLRTVATSSGDKGRDAELYRSEGMPNVMIQFSVAADWSSKINNTLTTITKNFPDTRVLIYVSNQTISAKADRIRSVALKTFGFSLDIRDQNWFLDRYALDPDREKIAEDFAKKLVDPLLERKGIIARHATALTAEETQSALVYLELQWEDDSREKGLTKLCFEALVRTALRDTDSKDRIPRKEVLARVQSLLASHPPETIELYTNNALRRLSKNAIKHWEKSDEFCASFEETQRLADRLVRIEYEDIEFRSIIKQLINHRLGGDNKFSDVDKGATVVRTIVEKFLLRRGESFAKALNIGDFELLNFSELRQITIGEVSKLGASTARRLTPVILEEVSINVLIDPDPKILPRLRRLANAYTLMAFLKETPDVQSTIKKIFSGADVWLDTSVILPVMAEDLLENGYRRFKKMLLAARESGIDLFVIPGVIEEISAHITRCFAYMYNRAEWMGPVPFLYAAHAVDGRSGIGFASWSTNFCGRENPEEDIAEYLNDDFGILVSSLEKEVLDADGEVRDAVKEEWLSVHEKRRKTGSLKDFDMHLASRLAEHDTENYLGVLQRRQQAVGMSPFGYKTWWLTLDKAAKSVNVALKNELSGVLAIQYLARIS